MHFLVSRLQLRCRDLLSLGSKSNLRPEELDLLVTCARDVRQDIAATSTYGFPVPPQVEAVLDMVDTFVQCTDEVHSTARRAGPAAPLPWSHPSSQRVLDKSQSAAGTE